MKRFTNVNEQRKPVGAVGVAGAILSSLFMVMSAAASQNAVVSAAPSEEESAVRDSGVAMGDATAASESSVLDQQKASALCNKIATKLNSVRRDDCTQSGVIATSGRSVRGDPILLKRYPAIDGIIPQGRVLLIGGTHGDELSSVSIVFRWMRVLNQAHSGLFDWTVVPLLNPDGLLQPRPTRTNANGVDLNRNFPTPNWTVESQAHWVKVTNRSPRRYPGVAPLSEPESRWLAELIKEFQPDAIVSVHAPHGILDYDGPKAAPKRLGKLRLSLLGTYPGSLGNYAGAQNSIPVVTIELPTASGMPKDVEAGAIWNDLVKWLRANVRAQPQQVKTEGGSNKS